MGPKWGPPGSCRPQMGPMLAQWTLLYGDCSLAIHCYTVYRPWRYLWLSTSSSTSPQLSPACGPWDDHLPPHVSFLQSSSLTWVASSTSWRIHCYVVAASALTPSQRLQMLDCFVDITMFTEGCFWYWQPAGSWSIRWLRRQQSWLVQRWTNVGQPHCCLDSYQVIYFSVRNTYLIFHYCDKGLAARLFQLERPEYHAKYECEYIVFLKMSTIRNGHKQERLQIEGAINLNAQKTECPYSGMVTNRNRHNWPGDFSVLLLRSCLDTVLTKTHYNDVTMGTIASQITSLTIVYSTVYSDADQRKHQSSASLAFVRGIHWGPVNSPHKWPVTRKMFPFDDVIKRSETVPSLSKGQS